LEQYINILPFTRKEKLGATIWPCVAFLLCNKRYAFHITYVMTIIEHFNWSWCDGLLESFNKYECFLVEVGLRTQNTIWNFIEPHDITWTIFKIYI
jgi:hypothetical protein